MCRSASTSRSASYPPPTYPATGMPMPMHVSRTSISRRRSPSSLSSSRPSLSLACTSTPASYRTRSGRKSCSAPGTTSLIARIYSASPAPLRRPTSRSLACLRAGKLSWQCTLRVNTRSSPWRMAAVPSPWWTSRSSTSTRLTRPSPSSKRAVTARSLKMQKPLPKSRCAWWVPPAVLHAMPCCSARRAVSSVPATSDSVLSTSTSLQGNPILRSSLSPRVPPRKAAT
mmetsp:Transcript_25309/g.80073  ORF Transcript_25309/g.80073 Transcript_25309/m.80073 type:complete len:228 (-) Transcript_25309:626-1309(-)